MEYEFDKEIDTLLRKARGDGPVLVGDVAAARHLDADQISAFAENALPLSSRALYMAHMADCDRCRKVLSNLLVMNSEAATAAAAAPSVITIAERSEPWYRKLFLFPNLAYVMGSLVLVLTGFLVYSIVQNSGMGDASVSQISSDEVTQGGPFAPESAFPDMAANSANMSASTNTAAVDQLRSAPSISTASTPAIGESRLQDNNLVLDGTPSVGSAAPAPPPPAAATQPVAKDDRRERDDLAAKTEEKAAGVMAQEAPKSEAMLKQQQYSNMPSQSGPMRNNESQYNRQLENMDRRAAAKRAARDEESSGRKVVSGKTFERKDGVWYDTTYQGRPTINVRRGTAEFQRLDGGLRSIANSFSGTIVVVWGAKAYRIQ